MYASQLIIVVLILFSNTGRARLLAPDPILDEEWDLTFEDGDWCNDNSGSSLFGATYGEGVANGRFMVDENSCMVHENSSMDKKLDIKGKLSSY